MDWSKFAIFFSLDYFLELIERYRGLGPATGILLPILEAFFPFLPLVAFVFANAATYGLWGGFLLSWVGSCVGSILLFLLIRKFGQRRFFLFLNTHPKVKKSMNWVERKGFGPIFLLYSFPFAPSSFITVVSALSRLSVKQFILALSLGKFIVILLISYIGHDFTTLLESPKKIIIMVGIVFALWYSGKLIEVKLELKG